MISQNCLTLIRSSTVTRILALLRIEKGRVEHVGNRNLRPFGRKRFHWCRAFPIAGFVSCYGVVLGCGVTLGKAVAVGDAVSC